MAYALFGHYVTGSLGCRSFLLDFSATWARFRSMGFSLLLARSRRDYLSTISQGEMRVVWPSCSMA